MTCSCHDRTCIAERADVAVLTQVEAVANRVLREHPKDGADCGGCGWRSHPGWPKHYEHQARVIAETYVAASRAVSP